MFYKLTCDCGTVVEVETRDCPGFSDHEDVYCPECKEKISTIRADMGYDIINVIKPK